MALLYHCFPRKQKRSTLPTNAGPIGTNDDSAGWEQAKAIFSNILEDGIYLTEENISIPWDDPFGDHKSTDISFFQYRFCLTSLSEDEDLYNHCQIFGNIGLGFGLDEIRQLGGFPVFYLPSPSTNPSWSRDRLNFSGVSLVYRIAEMRSIFETVESLPQNLRQLFLANVSDFDNMMGALRFFGNMLYFTDYLRQNDTMELRYYKQREWRIIAGLGGEKAVAEEIQFNQKSAFVLRNLGNIPVQSLIKEVVLCGSPLERNELEDILQKRQLQIPVRLIKP
jgi:hypothetical protein